MAEQTYVFIPTMGEIIIPLADLVTVLKQQKLNKQKTNLWKVPHVNRMKSECPSVSLKAAGIAVSENNVQEWSADWLMTNQ